MNKAKPEVKEFLAKSKVLLEPPSTIDELAEVLRNENIRQVKKQLASDLAPLLNRLTIIERQQTVIIGLLKKKLDLDAYEKEIMDLLMAKMKES